MISRGYLFFVKIESNFHCLACQTGKQHALPFNNSDSFASVLFDLVYSDVWGPSPIFTMRGSRYFVIFIDDYSRFTWIYLMHSRSELLGIYDAFQRMIQTQFSRKIKIFRSDNAQEYKQTDFLNILKQNGTLPHSSCPGTSQQNGRAERKLRHILDTVRALLLLPLSPNHFEEKLLLLLFTP